MEEKRNEIKQILPFSTVWGISGVFFTVVSLVYAVTRKYCPTEVQMIWIASEGVVLFLFLQLTFLIIGIKNIKATSKEEAYNDSQKCLKCIDIKMGDGFHNHGLKYLNELIAYEGMLAKNNNPEKCEVLVYTSDLATEKDAEAEVIVNRNKKVNYVVLFFANTCSDEDKLRFIDRYGSKNLVDLSESDEFKNSFDGKLAETLGFDIMIYKNSDGSTRGFFAVDFVPENTERGFHNYNCHECNYGKKRAFGENHGIPFYKEFSSDIATQLFDAGMLLKKKMRG